MTLHKNIKCALLIAFGTTLAACDALQITGAPAIGAANAGNLLDQGGFEGGFGNWRACSDPTSVELDSNQDNTESSAKFSAGGCLHQTVSATANDNMVVTCSASKRGNNWASISFGYLDENFQPLKVVESPITGNVLTDVTATLRAPINTAHAEVAIYTENGGEVDNCELINLSQGLPEEFLLNPYFEEGLDGWQSCSHGSNTAANDTATITESCISQKFTAYEGVELQFTCDGVKIDERHAAVALGYLDIDNQPIGLSETPITTEEGGYPTVTAVAPATAFYAQAMVYTEGEVNLNLCSLQEIASDPL